MNFFEKQRHEWIANRHDPFNRQDLVNAFDISIPQASKDINKFNLMNPGTLIYNHKKRRYEKLIQTAYKYSLDEMKAAVRTHIPDFDMATEIMRRIGP